MCVIRLLFWRSLILHSLHLNYILSYRRRYLWRGLRQFDNLTTDNLTPRTILHHNVKSDNLTPGQFDSGQLCQKVSICPVSNCPWCLFVLVSNCPIILWSSLGAILSTLLQRFCCLYMCVLTLWFWTNLISHSLH